MDREEIYKELQMTYDELQQYLIEKYKLLSISNPYEIRIMILRIMIMIELQQYDEAITYSEGIMKITTVDEVKELNILAKELKNKGKKTKNQSAKTKTCQKK